MSRIRLSFLGPTEIRRDEKQVNVRPAKAVALLSYLAMTGRAQTRDHVADLLWPTSLPDAARKNLRNTLWTLRKDLGENVLSDTSDDRISLSGEVWVDVHAFERGAEGVGVADLETALGLYRGSLLEGLVISDAPELEIWLTTEKERLGQLYLRTLEQMMAARQAEADWPGVLTLAQKALAADNLQEPVHRAVMVAHSRMGNRAEALRQYERLSSMLDRELGVDPLPETQTLRDTILRGDLPPAAAAGLAAPPRAGITHEPESRPCQPFVGRQAELSSLDEAHQLATSGTARMVLITGELGIGKSRLCQHWSATLGPESVILDTRCLDSAQPLPFAPLTRLFRREVCLDSLLATPPLIAPLWLAELARLIPEMRLRWTDLPQPDALPPEEERRRLFETFTQVLLALQGRPLVLFVDDLHWVDRASLDWLVYLMDRMEAEPLLVVGAYRGSDAPDDLERAIEGWLRAGIARRLQLGRLTVGEATELLRALGSEAAEVGSLHARSGGNPYFLIELSRASGGAPPPELAELVRTRLGRLPATARQILEAAAILESDFEFGTLRRTSGRGEEETLGAVDVLLEAEVLTAQDSRFDFSHPMVASIVRDDLSTARRTFLHRRAAEALQSVHAGRLAPVAGQLVNHYTHSGQPGQVAHYAEMAAERSLSLTAPSEAVTFYRQALSLEPAPARRLGLGRALVLQGELEQGRKTLGEALEEFEAQGNLDGIAAACLALADSYLPSGRGDEVIYWTRRALPPLEAQGDPRSLAYAHYLLGAGGLKGGGSLAEAESSLALAAKLAKENHLGETAAQSQFELGNLMAQRGELEAGIQSFREAISLAQQAGTPFLEVLAHNNLAYHALLAGDLEIAEQNVKAGLRLADEFSLSVPRQYLFSTHGELALAQGELDEADGWLERALSEAEKHGNQIQSATVRANQGLVARARGHLDDAQDLLETARRLAGAGTDVHLQIKIDLWLAELYREKGQDTAAQEALDRAERRIAGGERRGLEAWATRIRKAEPRR